MHPAVFEHDAVGVLETLIDGVVKLDADGRVLYVNAAAERILGLQRSELVGERLPSDWMAPSQELERDGRHLRVQIIEVDLGCSVMQIREDTERVEAERRCREAESALERNQEFLQAVLDNIEAGIVACDASGTLRFFNNATRAFHGIREEPVAPEHWASRYRLYCSDGLTLLKKEEVPLFRAYSGEVVRNVEMVIAPHDGPRRTVLASGRALIGRHGEKIGAVVAMHDVTHRKISGARLREALRQFRALFNNAPIAYHEIDREGIVRRVNRVECRLFERSRQEIIGRPVWDFVAEEERDRFRITVLERLSGLWPLSPAEHAYVTASGRRLSLELHENLILDQGGEIAGIRTALLDVTERKQRELAEAESAKIRSILERIGDAYIAFDTEWRYTYVNGKAAELARKPASELIGKCVWDEFPESVHTPFYRELQRSLHQQVPLAFDNFYAPLGKWFENTVYPSPSGVGVFYRDISERVRTHRALEKRTAELARKNEELQMFASVASHDMQEPLRMVGAYAALLARRYSGTLDEDADEFISYITHGVDRMQRLIKDLLALCRLEEPTEARLASVDVGQVVDLVQSNLSLLIEDTTAAIEKGQLPVIHFHPTQLLQVLQNLIGNALKYRRAVPPHIVVAAERYTEGWRLSVSDNGSGFEMQFAPQVFRPFRRLQRNDDTGTGIGLAICKKIVESRGGTIWVESAPGIGSTFFFTVPDALPSRE